MFWILKAPKIAANFISNVFVSGIFSKDCTSQASSSYDRLTKDNYLNFAIDEPQENADHFCIDLEGQSEDSDQNVNSPVVEHSLNGLETVSACSNEGDLRVNTIESDELLSAADDFERTSFNASDLITCSSSFSQLDIDDSDIDDEDLTCNVCDRAYPTLDQLLNHQLKKRHYGCSICEDVFPTWMALEAHKELSGHLSDDEELDDGEDLFYDKDYMEEDEEEVYTDSDFDEIEDEDDRERLL